MSPQVGAVRCRHRRPPSTSPGTRHASRGSMPYATNTDLPDAVRRSLPAHAQDIYRAAFNAAYDRYGPARESTARRIAWAAVKRSYVQRGVGSGCVAEATHERAGGPNAHDIHLGA